ncbi:thioredoxin family protein [Thalassobellus citreus]|uniref:thioredoxin family protein n=1 Tax=Thalassobellus citreus TaxID=3367752 RepID=UPI00379EBC03
MSKTIKVLGTGCPKCKTLTSLVETVVNENNINATVEKVEDIMEIMTFNVMSTPALVIDGVVTIKGRIPSKQEILELLQTPDQKKDNETEGSCCSKDGCC